MKHYFLTLTCAVILSGCGIFKQPVPVVPKFPEATTELMEKCQPLQKIEGNQVAITDFLKTVVSNYALYYECSTKVDGWQDWYTQQKKNYQTIK